MLAVIDEDFKEDKPQTPREKVSKNKEYEMKTKSEFSEKKGTSKNEIMRT